MAMNDRVIPLEEPRPVVVGVDGWEDGHRALLWAADEATRRGTALHIVHAWQLPRYGTLGPPMSADGKLSNDPIERAVQAILRRSKDAVHGRCPNLVIETKLVTGEAAEVIAEASRGAALVAIGCRGLPGLTGLVLGAVGGRVVAHAHCPVVVVRGVREHHGPVVVGVSEHPHSVVTLRRAAEMAALRGAPLHVIHVVRHPRTPIDTHAHEKNLRAWAVDMLATAARPELDVTAQVITGDPRHELLELSLTARLLVAGSHSHRSLIGVALGSVSGTMSQSAGCPVMICPAPELAEATAPEQAAKAVAGTAL
jgi:nucleotide-binding universal stress UspA family protein